MKMLIATAVFVVALCAVTAAARVQEHREGNEPEVVATGAGRIEVDPEMARIDIRVRGFGDTIDKAAEVCASNYRHLLDTLASAGYGCERVITRHLDTYEELDREKRRKIIGHWFIRELYIETKDLDEILEIARYVMYSGVATANVTWLLSSRADSERRKALADAVSDARIEAEAMAASAGGELGELIELTTDFPENPKFPTSEAIAFKGGIVQRSSIKPQKIKVNILVLGRWRLIGGFEN